MPGVVCVLTGADLGLPPMHEVEDVPETFARPILCDGIVRFVGEPVAVVVADSRAHAVDAAESVLVEYDSLPAVVDPVRALEPDAPVLFPEHGSNAAVEYTVATDPGALEDAEVVIRARFVNQRLAPTPMETNGALAVPDPDTGGLTVWLPVQAPFASRKTVARILGPRGVEGPRHRAEGRRRVRREDPDLRGAGGGLCARPPARATDPVRGDPDGEHDRHDPRAGPGAGRGARRAPRRHDHRPAGPDHGRRRRVSRRGRDASAAHGTDGLRAVPRSRGSTSPPQPSRPTRRRSGPTGAPAVRRRRRSSSA